MPWVLRGICTSVHPMGLSLEDIAHTLPEPRSQSKRRVRGAAALKLEGSTGMSWHDLRWKTCQRLVSPGSKINHTSSKDDSSKIVPWCTFICRWTSEKGRGSRFHYIFSSYQKQFWVCRIDTWFGMWAVFIKARFLLLIFPFRGGKVFCVRSNASKQRK